MMYFVFMNGKPISKHKTEETADKKVLAYMKLSNTFRKHERLEVKAILAKSHVYDVEFIPKESVEFTPHVNLVNKYQAQFKR